MVPRAASGPWAEDEHLWSTQKHIGSEEKNILNHVFQADQYKE